MKKFFLIPLLTLMCSVMAWGETYQVGTYAQLKAALEAGDATLIELTTDITYDGAWKTVSSTDLNAATTVENALCIKNSLTLDGQGHKLIGWGKHDIAIGATNGVLNCYPTAMDATKAKTNINTIHRVTLALHPDDPEAEIVVTLKNISLGNTTRNNRYYGVIAFDGVKKIVWDNVNVECGQYSSQQALCTTGALATPIELAIANSNITVGNSGYATYFLKPITGSFTNTEILGWCGLYFKNRNIQVYGAVAGSRGSKVTCDACKFTCRNVHSGTSNDFALFPMEDDGITLTLNNCSLNAEQIGNQSQAIVSLQAATRTDGYQPVTVNISGDNTHVYNVHQLPSKPDYSAVWNYFATGEGAYRDVITGDMGGNGEPMNVALNVNITGGTYSVDPSAIAYPVYGGGTTTPNIPSEYEVKEISQGGKTVYRVVKKAEEKTPGVKYDLNDDVPTDEPGAGNNPATSFELSTGTDMTLNQETTEAGYVQVKDNGTDATTITIAKNETNTDQSQKLVINNGLDVQGESQVIVEPTAALIIGEGGIVTSKPENIILKADEDGAATLLLDPAITVNQNPNLTVTLKAQSKQLTASPWTYVFQRFAIPVKVGVKPTTDHAGKALFPGETSFESYVFQWNGYSWVTSPSWTALKPFVGYQLANNSADGGITYTFTGELVGNDNSTYEFPTGGFDFFGNSHLAPIYIDSLLKPYLSSDVEATVWLYDYDSKNFLPITAEDLAEGFSDLPTEIKPMEGFILNLHAASGSATMDYASAIWGNPKFDAVLGRPSQKGAPARKSAGVATSNRAMVVVSAMNGMSDNVKLIEKETYSADFENGADASKFKFEEAINLYAETEAGELSRVATNDMKGTLLSFQSGDDTSYTLSLSNVLGEDYMLRDNVTGALVAFEEGATYTFMQDANTTVPARFEVVSAAKITTAIDSVEAEANASGIYSITGQFLGRDFTKLPAGVYVVNGVKIVK